MKALTLTQPWAQLVQIGAKRVETRSWSTDYRGELAIHAAKGWKAADRVFCGVPAVKSALEAGGYRWPITDLPHGCVIAIVTLVDVTKALYADVTPEERAFGDYSLGRFAWWLADVRAITPVPARGALGLWEWRQP